MVDKELIAEIKNSVNIVEVIGVTVLYNTVIKMLEPEQN